MEVKDFAEIARHRLNVCRDMIIQDEYDGWACDGDRLHNFKILGVLRNEMPEKALWSLANRYFTSILEIINDLEVPDNKPNIGQLEGKITHLISYLIVLEALFKEREGGGKR